MHRPEMRADPTIQMVFTTAMQHAFTALQLPVGELAEWLALRIAQNPVLDCTEDSAPPDEDATSFFSQEEEIDFEKSGFEVLEGMDEAFSHHMIGEDPPSEPSLSYPPSLSDHLMAQAREAFTEARLLKKAEEIIGNLDARGYYTLEMDEKTWAVLRKMQTFDPPGIGARTPQEALLIQLRQKGREHSLGYALIARHFDALLHNKRPALAKELGCTPAELQRIIDEEIAPLEIYPGYRFCAHNSSLLLPDLTIRWEGKWEIEIHEEGLPSIQIAPFYRVRAEEEGIDPQEKRLIRRWIAEGHWLQRIVERRHKTLRDIATLLTKRHSAFLKGTGHALAPLTVQEVARELRLNASTVARAISCKVVACAQGTRLLRHFFSHPLADGTLSVQGVKHLLVQLIQGEDRNRPLSDQALALKITALGVPCARRTIAKYRASLHIPPASYRRGTKVKAQEAPA